LTSDGGYGILMSLPSGLFLVFTYCILADECWADVVRNWFKVMETGMDARSSRLEAGNYLPFGIFSLSSF
jgi:hypothetical protein